MLIGITARARNGIMLKYRIEHGLTQVAAARQLGIHPQIWNSMELLRFDANRLSWNQVTKVAKSLGCLPEELIPEELRGYDCRVSKVVFRQVEAERMLAERTAQRMILPAPDKQVELEDLRNVSARRIEKSLKKLTYRQREILKLRFGLNERRKTYTLEEIGRMFKITRERVRSIEAGAVAKLRTQKISDFLRECLPDQAKETRR